ncbi:magnesium-translocating P-type ATPase [Kitasatospora nipponensis]|uniref:Magnesium-translocating P-type ATPase n=1 Tax=Kitasatospora nipponensis TaxID=258049 RepID=A0ABP4G6H5_9ACTN
MPEDGVRLLPLPGPAADGPQTWPEAAQAAPAPPERLSRLQALRAVQASPRGLTEDEAERRLAVHGENTVLPPPGPGRPRRVLATLADPFAALLAGLAVICAAIGSWGSAVILGVLVLTACALRYLGERRSARALRALRALLPGTATVRRRASAGERALSREVPADQLVPGDVVELAGGDAVPADVRLLWAEGLTVDQSALTGRSEPVERAAPDLAPPVAGEGPFEAPQLCFAGSRVAAGRATAVVLATGAATRFGAAHRPSAAPRGAARSAVERGVRRAVWTMILFMLVAVPLTVGADTLLHGWSRDLLPFAVAAAVGLTPELLPLVLSAVQARGSRELAGRGLLVRRLPAVGELGALEVLCVDKTGTLTTGRLEVAGSLDPAGRPDPQPLRWAAVAGEAALLHADPGLLESADEALLVAADAAGLLEGPPAPVLEVLPFDPVRRRSGVLLREHGRQVLLVKGAPETVLARCTEAVADGGVRPLHAAARAELTELVAARAGRGLPLLAVAGAASAPALGGPRPGDEDGLTLLGFVELRDEAAESAAGALAELARQGVAVTVLTGDHPSTALRLREALALPAGPVLLGDELAALSGPERAEAAGAGALFARCTPAQKARVVRALRAGGRSVGFLGDGVNDIPALRAADVGISAGGAVGAARAWAEVVIEGPDLAAVGRAVVAGRVAVARVAAYLRIALSCNLGNALSMLVGGVLLPFLPMQPAQVLLQNLCFDAAQLSFALSGPQPRPGRRPVRLRWGALALFAAGFGLLNSVGDLAMFAAMREVTRGFSVPDAEQMFHTAWFTENLLTQALALPALYGLGGVRARAPRTLWWSAGALALVGLLLPPSALGEALGFEGLPAAAYGALALVAFGYAALLRGARALWLRRGGGPGEGPVAGTAPGTGTVRA